MDYFCDNFRETIISLILTSTLPILSPIVIFFFDHLLQVSSMNAVGTTNYLQTNKWKHCPIHSRITSHAFSGLKPAIVSNSHQCAFYSLLLHFSYFQVFFSPEYFQWFVKISLFCHSMFDIPFSHKTISYQNLH